MDLLPVARVVAVFGLVLLVIAGVLFLAAKFNISLGNLPGDFVFKRGNITCVIPLVSSLLISIVVTILLKMLLALPKK